MAEDKNMDALIDELSAELEPVSRFAHPFARISPWIIIAVAYISGVIHFLGIRMDIGKKLGEASFLFEMGLTGLIAIFAAYVSGWLTIPDMREQRWMLAVPTSLFAVFMLFIGAHVVAEGITMPAISWHHCFSDALLMGVVPIAMLSVLVRRGATTRPLWLAFMSTLSVGAMGWAAMRITCPSDMIGHTMMFHFLPFILFAVLLGVLARRLYRW